MRHLGVGEGTVTTNDQKKRRFFSIWRGAANQRRGSFSDLCLRTSGAQGKCCTLYAVPRLFVPAGGVIVYINVRTNVFSANSPYTDTRTHARTHGSKNDSSASSHKNKHTILLSNASLSIVMESPATRKNDVPGSITCYWHSISSLLFNSELLFTVSAS